MSSLTSTNKLVEINIEGDRVSNSNEDKLLGIKIYSRFTFESLASSVCKKILKCHMSYLG